jgi:hypothetical protein
VSDLISAIFFPRSIKNLSEKYDFYELKTMILPISNLASDLIPSLQNRIEGRFFGLIQRSSTDGKLTFTTDAEKSR